MFLHRITGTRVSASEKLYLDTFRRMCGENAYPNVAFVTTMWNSVDKGVGLRREVELQVDYWSDFIAQGSPVFQYNDTPDIAQAIVAQLIAKDDVVLRIQDELSDDRCKLGCTSAGAELASQLEKQLEARRQKIKSLNVSLREAVATHNGAKVQEIQAALDAQREKQLKQIKARDALRPKIGEETEQRIKEVNRDQNSKGERWKSKLQVFAAVLSPVIALTVHFILPLAGVSVA